MDVRRGFRKTFSQARECQSHDVEVAGIADYRAIPHAFRKCSPARTDLFPVTVTKISPIFAASDMGITPETVHDHGFDRAHRINFGDDYVGAQSLGARMATPLPHQP